MDLTRSHEIDQPRHYRIILKIYGLTATSAGKINQMVEGVTVSRMQVQILPGIMSKPADKDTGIFVFLKSTDVVNRDVIFHIQRYFLPLIYKRY
ncbi:hypothetical protein D3C71_2037800 [compost metagenome]